MKTQKSFRKKALLSSVAMLLVAMVALGSATFAWFTQSPTASASGLVMKATASNGLKILTQSHKTAVSDADYLSSDYLNYDNTTQKSSTDPILLNPASYEFTTNSAMTSAFKTTAKSDDSYSAETDANVSSATVGFQGTNDVYAEEIYCKLVGASSEDATTTLNLSSLKVNMNDLTLKNAIRVIVTYKASGGSETVIGAYAESGKTNGSLKQEGTYETAKGEEVSFESFTSVKDKKLGTLGQTGNDAVKVYIYLDGEDENCTSKNIKASDIITSVEVNLSIPTTT